ncbi:hypothetical protein Sjap_021880 [Stephania japonica]|uniref:Protein EXORDIUM-like n=1 Tax=Stephania japonica TaxID=461633 RepID=A0AAP0EV05_9MAGN
MYYTSRPPCSSYKYKPSNIYFFNPTPLKPTLTIAIAMAGFVSSMLVLIVQLHLLLFIAAPLFQQFSLATARPLMASSDGEKFSSMKYHKGHLLTGNITVNLIWYGKFKPTQRAIISDFFISLSSSVDNHPSASTWWKATQKYYYQPINNSPHSALTLTLGNQFLDETYSLSKSLSTSQIVQLASKGGHRNAINVVLTAPDVTVNGFCSSRCGTHGSAAAAPVAKSKGSKIYKHAYIWVGNSETQCPGQCAWPFHQQMYGPQSAPLVAPNGNVGMDGMVINLASLLAGTVTNPFGNGYYQGPAEAPLEAASACAGIYGRGAYPGYAGELLKDESSGGSFNAYGINGRKYLLPALFNPKTSSCEALV